MKVTTQRRGAFLEIGKLNSRFKLFSIAFALLAAASIAFPASGQQQNAATIQGKVTDPSGLAVPDASVSVTEASTGVTSATKTDKTGNYVLLNLPIGSYRLAVSSPGFSTGTAEAVRLVAGVALAYDVQLKVGSVNESVTVSSAPPRIDTINSDMGTTMTKEELTAVPLVMGGQPRSSLAFLTTLSGINTVPKTSTTTNVGQPAGFANSSIQGSSPYGGNQNNVGYTIDGASATYRMFTTVADYASILPEAIQEVRLASNFNAEQGWDSGTEVALVTRSGTNQFHGSVFEFIQNTDLDSRNYFASRAAEDHQNEFGFLIGGPIRRDKTFFFGTLDFFRYQYTQNGITATVPTALMQTGNFTEVLGAKVGTDALGRPVYTDEIYDPSTTRTLANGTIVRDPFSCNGVLNVMCPGSFSKISSAFAAGYPSPTTSGTQNNWLGSNAPSPVDIAKFLFKIDQQIGRRFRLTASFDAAPNYNQDVGAVNFGPLLTATLHEPAVEYRPRATFVGTLSPKLIFNAYFSANYVKSQINLNGEKAATAGQVAGLTGVYTPNLPIVTISNTTGFGNAYLSNINPAYTLPNLGTFFEWLKDGHSIKLGADYVRAVIKLISQDMNTAGSYTFSNLTTGLPSFSTTGWGYASFLTGNVNSALIATPKNLYFQGEGFDVYGQDQWQVRRNLTINYGLRWSASIGPWEANNQFGAFDPTVPNPAAGNLPGAISFWGSGAGENGHHYLWKPSFALFDPRVGIAYSPMQNLAIRAYYGIITIPGFSNLNQGTVAPSYGAVAQSSISTTNNGVTPAFDWDGGYPNLPVVPTTNPSFLNGSAVSQLDYNHNETGRTQTFGLSIERALPWGLTAKGEYVGKMIHGQMLINSIFFANSVGGFPGNQLPLNDLSLGSLLIANITSAQAVAAGIKSPYAGFTGSVAQALLPFPQYTYVGQDNNTGSFSEYNSGHVALQKRSGHGLSFLVDYTFSKQMVSGYYQDTLSNTRKMLSPVDIPWNLAISYAYDLPFGPGRAHLNGGGVVDRLVGDWTVSGIQNYQAGSVINVSPGTSIPGVTYLEAVRVPGVAMRTATSCSAYIPGQANRYLNSAAFAAPAPYTLGNVYELPNVRNCGYYDENLSLTKTFKISERSNFVLSGNFFNALNRHTWSGLQTNASTPSTFGSYTAATSPRTIQLVGRITF